MRKSQIEEISDLLLSYSAGNYKPKGFVSDKSDEIDMIILGINMLGEELRSSNVSKEYFSSIFNAVTDLVLIVDEDGSLIDFNISVNQLLGYEKKELESSSFLKLISQPNSDLFNEIKQNLKGEDSRYIIESELITKKGKILFGLFSCSKIFDRFGEFNGYLVSVKDITSQKENEKLILKTIISTQSTEQLRVANDLHDSLGQELSMAQLMLSNFSRYDVEDKEFYNLVELCSDILTSSIKHLREICFDLMPNVLVKGGIEIAIETLVGKLESLDKVEVDFVCTENFPRLFSEIEIVIYRIIQEFINNMIKHSQAKRLTINLIEHNDTVEIILKENGQGFDLKKLENIGENRGISNIRTKVVAYNGQYELKSAPGDGTELWVIFPKKDKDE